MKSRQFNTVEQPFNINHNQTIQGSENNTENEKPRAIIFGSDQSPSNSKNAHWIKYLNQESGFLFGAENVR